MRNVSLLFFALLSLNFSTYPMLRSVRSRAAKEIDTDHLKRLISSRACVEALGQAKKILISREFELQERISHIAMLQGRYAVAQSYADAGSEETYRDEIIHLIRGNKGDWERDGLPSIPKFEDYVSPTGLSSSSRRVDIRLKWILENEAQKLKIAEEKIHEKLRLIHEDKRVCIELLEINKLD